ncbi:alpha/beta hydrolase family protein [Streptosporangium sp. NBC_01469]|uniref:alpha/beta hydrolase family protein n=1 Tax=Streptosporangium sp. NBC_01469 TaxID=2903898 RepID=UPI002E2E1FD1|nr:alpha/beta fold hydrolase [Streptosporangium sp. NBC_01469]
MTGPPIMSRGGARFSTGGTRAACLASDDRETPYVEGWELTGGGPRVTLRAELTGESAMAQIVVLEDGGLVLAWHEPGRQVVRLFGPDGRGRTIGTVEGSLRLLPGPGRPGWLATAVGVEADGSSVVHRLTGEDPWLEPVARVPGRLGGAVFHDGRIVATAILDGTPTPVTVDPGTGTTGPFLDPPVDGACHVLLAGAGRVLLAVETGAGPRLGLVESREPGPVRLLEGLDGLPGVIAPVALDPAGRSLAFAVTRGARSELALYDIEAETLRWIAVPPGKISPPAVWTGHGLWFPFSPSARPTAFGWLPPGEADVRMGEEPEPVREPARWQARLETFRGPAGPVEAVVHGPDWRAGGRVVVALHGGPDRHWSLAFDGFFQMLADAGLTVVAPNQRGSTGYGRAHAEAIVGAWGGPDLDDIRALCGTLTAGRPSGAEPPALYGSSYGGFLALLAAAADPGAWSACVAVAPFRSAASLYAQAPQPVRNLIDRLGGLGEVTDALGPRDLASLVPRIRARVLIAHGLLDETIPVTQSRELVDRLISAGHPDVTYREPANRGHIAFGARSGDPLAREITAFLTQDGHRVRAAEAATPMAR